MPAKAPKAAPKAQKQAPKPAKAQAPEKDLKNYDERALFLSHLPLVQGGTAAVEAAAAKVKSAKESLKKLLAAAAADGFSKADFEYALDFESPDKELAAKDNIARRLKIAGFMGSDLGNQLDLFLEPDRTPIADRAFEEGKAQALQNLPAKPSYDPSTEAYRQYLKGFHSVSEKIVLTGFTPFTAEELETQQDLADEASKH